MKKQNNLVIQAAIAAAFGTVAVPAMAVVDLVAGTGTPKFASEIPSSTTVLPNASNALDMTIAMPSGIKPSNAKPVYVKVNLTAGAKFTSAPTISCTVSGAAAGFTDSTGAGTGAGLNVGGIGFNNVTFVISGYHTAGDAVREESGAFTGGNCTISASAYTISGLNSVAASGTVEYTNGLSSAVTGNAANLITFANGLSGSYSAAATAPQVDATSGSDNYVTGVNVTQHTALLGYVTFGSKASAVGTAGSVALTAGDAITTASITISGPALAAALALGNSGVYLVSANSECTATVSVATTFQASATNSVTFNNITPTQVSAGIAVCARASGTTLIGTGVITASMAPSTAVANVTVNMGSGNLSTVATNGITRNAYFVNSSTSTNKTSVLRVVNTGSVAGDVWGTAYNEAGTQIGTVNGTLGTAIAAGQMLSLTSAQIETALGLTGANAPAATAKYRVVLSGAISGMEVLNFTKDVATGNLALSQSQTN